MMSTSAILLCFASLVLSAAQPPSTPTDGTDGKRFGGAVEVRRFNFEQDEDADYDNAPDDWSRVKTSGYPHYITAEIDPEEGASGKRSLRFDADGGNVTYFSPPVSIDFRQSYVVQGMIRTRGLNNDWATLSATFLDSLQRPVEQLESRPLSGTEDWTEIQLGPVVPSDPTARLLVVGCHLRHGSRLDLKGAAWFDDLWIGRLPRMATFFPNGEHFFGPLDHPVAHCLLSGFETTDLSVEMTLSDVFGRVLGQSSFVVEEIGDTRSTGDGGANPPRAVESEDEHFTAWESTDFEWEVPAQPPGFYRVTATLLRGTTPLFVDTLTMAVISPSPASPTGEFGWSLESVPADLTLSALAGLAARARINWLKYPVWSLPQNSPASSEAFTRFLEELDRSAIGLVGLLNNPPDQVRQYLSGKQSGASDVFRLGPDRWYPSLEPLLASFALKVRWWQLGGERDRSFVGIEGLGPLLRTVRGQLNRVGRDVNLGVPWDWMYPGPESVSDQLGFVSLSSQPSLTNTELATHLAQPSSIPRWVALSPLPAGPYSVETRASDLVRRMLAAKQGGANVIFATDPFDAASGLVSASGAPTDLFLPWRTVSDTLAGADYLGSLVLPGGSSNAVFRRDRQLVVVVWNDRPTVENLYLGEQVFAVDIWGRRHEVPFANEGQQLEVGALPLFLFNASDDVARWRIATAFTNGRIASQTGSQQETIHFRNTFSQGVSGRATLVLPQGWSAEPASWEFQLGANETFEQAVVIGLPFDASQGTQMVAIDFDVNADRHYRFRAYRPYELGLGDVELEVLSNLTPDGELEIEQRVTNDTEEVLSFECVLEAPRRKREKTMVIKLGRGRDTKFYLLPNGKELLGKTLSLRAREVGGPRIINRQFVVGE